MRHSLTKFWRAARFRDGSPEKDLFRAVCATLSINNDGNSHQEPCGRLHFGSVNRPSLMPFARKDGKVEDREPLRSSNLIRETLKLHLTPGDGFRCRNGTELHVTGAVISVAKDGDELRCLAVTRIFRGQMSHGVLPSASARIQIRKAEILTTGGNLGPWIKAERRDAVEVSGLRMDADNESGTGGDAVISPKRSSETSAKLEELYVRHTQLVSAIRALEQLQFSRKR